MNAQSILIDLEKLSAIAKCAASKEETRYYLNGVLLEVAKGQVFYVATDGHTLVCAHEELTDKAVKFSAIIPTNECVAWDKMKDNKPAVFTLKTNTLAEIKRNGVTREFAPIQGTYPDWRRVIPVGKVDPKEPAVFDPQKLTKLQRMAAAIGHKKHPTVVSETASSPALVGFGEKAKDIFAVLMPVRAEMILNEAPKWVGLKKQRKTNTKKKQVA